MMTNTINKHPYYNGFSIIIPIIIIFIVIRIGNFFTKGYIINTKKDDDDNGIINGNEDDLNAYDDDVLNVILTKELKLLR